MKITIAILTIIVVVAGSLFLIMHPSTLTCHTLGQGYIDTYDICIEKSSDGGVQCQQNSDCESNLCVPNDTTDAGGYILGVCDNYRWDKSFNQQVKQGTFDLDDTQDLNYAAMSYAGGCYIPEPTLADASQQDRGLCFFGVITVE